MKESNEKEKTTQSYIVNFYALVQQLIGAYSEYEELLLEVEGFKEQNPDVEMDSEQQDLIKNANRFLRKIVTQIQMHYETFEYKKSKKDDDIIKSYKDLNKNYLLDKELLKNYIVEINKYTLDRIMPHISENTNIGNVY